MSSGGLQRPNERQKTVVHPKKDALWPLSTAPEARRFIFSGRQIAYSAHHAKDWVFTQVTLLLVCTSIVITVADLVFL